MRGYQLKGLEWLLYMFDNGMSPILGDEMGLGKTMQSIAFIAALKEREVAAAAAGDGTATIAESAATSPYLVVAPLSVLSGWMREFRRWCPSLRVIRLHSNDKKEREKMKRRMLDEMHTYDVVLTTYEYLLAKDLKYATSSAIYWKLLVLDEGHRVKCPTSQISQAVKRMRAECTLLLTGTPLQNNLTELWALLNVLYPNVFTTSEPFDDAFRLS